MNYAIVFRLLGYVLMIEGALLLLPAAASLVYGEWMVQLIFLVTVICMPMIWSVTGRRVCLRHD